MLKSTLICLSIIIASTSAVSARDLTIKIDRELLETKSGPQKVMNRIDNKVRKYCLSGGSRSLQQRAQEEACVDEMTQKVLRKVNHPALSRLS